MNQFLNLKIKTLKIQWKLKINTWKFLSYGQSLGCFAFAHRYWRNLNWFILLRVLGCFGSPGSQINGYIPIKIGTFTIKYPAKRDGLPHSDTVGSKLRSSSPTTIVTMYVLLRKKEPRHSLSASVKTSRLNMKFLAGAFLFSCQRTNQKISVQWLVTSG